MKKIALGLLLILLTLSASALQAQDPAATPILESELLEVECDYDLTGQSYRFYHFGDLSGPYGFITTPVLVGFEDAIAYFNENGGLCGAEISAEYRDTAARGEAAQAIWDEFSARNDAHVMFLYLAEEAELIRLQAADAQIPLVVATSSQTSLYGLDGNDPAWVFGATPLLPDQLGAFCEYVSANWASFGIEGAPSLGHVSWIGGFGQSTDTPEARAYCETLGIAYAGAQYYFPGIPDISTQIQRLLDEGANILYTTSLATGPAQLAATVQALGLRDQVLIGGPSWVLDTSVMLLGGQDAIGIVGALSYYWWDEVSHPGVALVNAYWVQNRLLTADDPAEALALRNVAYLLAWGTVDFYRQFMTLTLNRVGPEGINGAEVYATLTSGIAFTPMSGLLTIQYGEEIRAPQRTRMGTIRANPEDGTLQTIAITDWFNAPNLLPSAP